MTGQSLPARDRVTVQFAHPAYRLAERFDARGTGVAHFQTSTLDDTLARVGAADVLVISGYWRNEILARAKRLAYVQSIGAATTSSLSTTSARGASRSRMRAASTGMPSPSMAWRSSSPWRAICPRRGIISALTSGGA